MGKGRRGVRVWRTIKVVKIGIYLKVRVRIRE